MMSQDPRRYDPDYWHLQANAARARGDLDNARAAYDRALRLASGNVTILGDYGSFLLQMGERDLAVKLLRRATSYDPQHAIAWANLGNALKDETQQFAEAAQCYETALEITGGLRLPFVLGDLHWCKMHRCDWSGYSDRIGAIETALAAGGLPCTPFVSLTLPLNAAQQLKIARRFTATMAPARLQDAAWQTFAKPKDGKISLGFFSADFGEHTLTWLLTPVFQHLDRSRFDVCGFSYRPIPKPGEVAAFDRLSAAMDAIVDISRCTDAKAAAISRAAHIDIAIDLTGHTAFGRPGIFANRAAPVQVNYFGYPGTSGAPYMDWIITDHETIPNYAERYFSERVMRLPHANHIRDITALVSDEPKPRERHADDPIVFCCFNSIYKITPDCFARWLNILKRVENSCLWLLADNGDAMVNLSFAAVVAGVDSARLVFVPRQSRADYLAAYRHMDLFLDTWPYGGHGTVSDALWMGVPVVTLEGHTYAGRVASALVLECYGGGLLARTPQEYEDNTVLLCEGGRGAIDELKGRLRTTGRDAAIFDAARYTRSIEAAFTTIWEDTCARSSPEAVGSSVRP